MKNSLIVFQIIISIIFKSNLVLAQSNIEQNDAKKTTEAVGEFTGTLNVGIPLASVSSGQLSVPIGISYVSNGLKPNEASSGIGLGWILNEPAVIYKTQMGMEDTYRKLYNKPLLIGSPINDQEDYLDDTADGAYDIYTYNILGYSGKILFNSTNNQFFQLNKSDLIFNFSGGLGNFEVILPDGTKVVLFRSAASIQTDDKDHPPVWHATYIYSYDLKDTIKLQYNTGAYRYYTLVDDHFIKENNYDSGTESHKTDWLDFPITLLTKVVGKNDSIMIEYSNRLDVTSVPQWSFPDSKCSKIKYISDNVCIENIFNSDYFESSNGQKNQIRLKEITTQKCNTPAEALPSYKFEYEGSVNTNGSQNIPERTVTGIDKWGYYNGYDSNPIYNMTPTTISGGGAIRSLITSNTKKGILKNITYPNGSITSFEYQQNKYSYSLNNGFVFSELYACHNNGCSSPQTVSSPPITVNNEMIQNGTLNLTLTPNSPISYNSYLDFKIKNNQGTIIKTISFSNTQGSQAQYYSIGLSNIKDNQNNPILISGNTYSFELSVTNGSGNAMCEYFYNNMGETECGGLRLSKITKSNGDTSKDIVTNYTYESGTQYQEPKFYEYFAGRNIYFNRTLKDENLLMDFNIGYNKVTISSPNNGKTVKLFKSIFNKEYGVGGSRIITDKLSQGVGSLLSQANYDNNNNLINKDSFEYNTLEYSSLPENHIYFANFSGDYYGYHLIYKTFIRRISKTLNYYYNNLTNTTEYSYGHSHTIQPSLIKVTSGNGNITETWTEYTNNTWASTTVKNYFINKNIIIPFTTNHYENSILVGSHNQQHAFYTSAGAFYGSSSTDPTHIVRASQLFKGDFNLAGTQTNTSEPAEYYNHEYTSQGFVKLDQKQNWLQKTFVFDGRERLTSVTDQNNFQASTIYYGNSNLVQRKTNVDGTYTDYEYDGLLRIKKETSQPSGVYTDYTYSYYTSTIPNSIKTKTTYHTTTVTGSSLTNIENIIYTDKLGRTMAKVAIKSSPTQKDVIICYEYDNQGRLIKEYLPVETTYSDGTYVAPLGTWKYQETKYEASPLSRVTEIIPPDWNYPTLYQYGLNTTGDAVNKQTSGSYDANKLIKQTIVDGNGNRSIKFTDFKGRTICERKTDAADTPAKRRDTYKHYDNKGRVTTVIPPDASTSTPEIIYVYTYDDENKLISKKVPGKGLVTFYYNNKDLIGAEQDALQASKNPKEWIVYSYDTNGRELKSGLFLSNILPDLNNPTFNTVYTENVYGTTTIDKDKINIRKVNILGTSSNLQTTYTYDTRGRVQSYSANNVHNVSSFNTTTFTYDNGNNVLSETAPLTVTIGGVTTTYTVANTYTYDHRNRTLDENFAYNGGAAKTVGTNVYNWKNELIQLRQGKHNATTYLQDIDFTYRPNGMLERINQYLPLTSSNVDIFYMEFYYDNPVGGSGSSIRKNGEIANIKWQRRNNTMVGGLHAYTYNEFGELLTNNYSTLTGATTFSTTTKFDESFGYNNKYGKITSLTRNNNAGTLIDNLSYFYISNNPRTSRINDGSGNTTGHNQNGQSQTNDVYTYDLNGNQKSDLYRGVSNINYNHLDLPILIDMGGGKKVEMTYDATGNMLTKKVYNTGAALIENRTYNKGFEFVAYGTGNQSWELIHHSQGYYRQVSAGSFRHEYTIKDHLGNTRIVYTDVNNNGLVDQGTDILDENHYYAYGMEMSDASYLNNSIYKYKFNGIERTESIGLNIDIALYRGLDPVLGKWYQVDPKAEYMHNMSPYCAMGNNPVLHTDPNGDILPAIIYAVSIGISAYQGYKIGKAQGASGWGLVGYTLAGATIGAVSGYAGSAITTSVLGATASAGVIGSNVLAGVAGGAVSGAISGGATSALARENVLNGAVNGLMWGAAIGGVVGLGSGIYAKFSAPKPKSNISNITTEIVDEFSVTGSYQGKITKVPEEVLLDDIAFNVDAIEGFTVNANNPGFKIEGQLLNIFGNKRLFTNWLKGNQSLSRIDNPLKLNEAQQIIDNANINNIPLEYNLKGLQGLEITGKWAGIPHFKVGNVHIPISKGLDNFLKFKQ